MEIRKNQLPFMSPKYLTENHLWDGEWLEPKYNNNNTNGKENRTLHKAERKRESTNRN